MKKNNLHNGNTYNIAYRLSGATVENGTGFKTWSEAASAAEGAWGEDWDSTAIDGDSLRIVEAAS